MATPKLKLGNDKWATKQRSLLAFNDEGNNFKSLPFQVERLSGGSYVGRNGLIQYAATEEPRIDFTNYSKGALLLEPTSTNLLQRSEDYANGYWLKSRVGSNATGFTAPDGSSNATYYEQASGQTTAAVIFKSAFTSASSGVYTFSIWAKKAEKRYLKLQTRVNSATYGTVFDLQDGVITYDSGNENAKIEEYPNGWYRLSVQRTSTTTDDIIVYYYLNDSAGASNTVTDSGGVYIWGSQVEKNDYLTSLIPTAGSAVTRTQDNAHLLNQTLITDYPFTAYANAKIDAVGNTIFSLNNTSSQNYYLAFYFGSSTQVSVGRGTLTANDFDNYNFSYSVGDTIKVAVAFISATAYKLYINGTELADVTSGTSIPFNHDDISLGQFRITGDTGTRNGVNEFMLFNEALTDQELIQLTS